MRITLLALGSQGDVQPFIALAHELARQGHEPRILAIADYGPLVRGYGVAFSPVIGLASDLMDRELVYGFLDRTSDPVQMALKFMRGVAPFILKLFQDCWEACRETELIIASSLGALAAYPLSEKLGVPCYVVHMHPNAPTRAFPHMFFPALPGWLPLRGRYNRLTHLLGEQGLSQLLRAQTNRARRDVLGLAALSAGDSWRRAASPAALMFHAYSGSVAPPPPDWSDRVHVTGYWYLEPPADWKPPAELVSFLEGGPPPVYVGFGSNLMGRHPEQVIALIVQALQEAGVRGLLFSGWDELGALDLPEDIIQIQQTPHAWLFPKVAAVVHHGGAGTTAAALGAGVPSVVVPFFGDQVFWARRVSEIGAGPEPIPRKALDKERLKAAILSAVRDPALRARAAVLGKGLRSEHGARRAAELIAQRSRHSMN
jgi:UDP:flavonoid glycosyltransferase YjiC (YdhE family)